jgi:hypothetical protein
LQAMLSAKNTTMTAVAADTRFNLNR